MSEVPVALSAVRLNEVAVLVDLHGDHGADVHAGATQRNTFGNINYLIYKVNDCLSIGNRFEWFNFGGAGFNNVKNDDNFNYTFSLPYRYSANLIFRPEARWVYDPQQYGFNENFAKSQIACGGDMVFTF